MDPEARGRVIRLLTGDRRGAEGTGAPDSLILRVWRGHPEIVFALCLTFLLVVDFSGITTNTWYSWTFQELTFQRITDPVVPFTVVATVVTAVVLAWTLTPRIGVIRASLVGISIPVGVLGVFELAFLFIVYPSAFWIPAHLDWGYWGYGFAILSYALFGFVGGGWWKLPRWWWVLLGGVAAGFLLWFAAGVPLTVPSIGGHNTPSDLLGIALVGNVVLKWAVFVLVAAPVVVGASQSARTLAGVSSPQEDRVGRIDWETSR